MNRLKQIIREVHRRSLWQIVGIYLAGSWVAFEVVSTLTASLELPTWFPALALVLLIVGLPVVVATAFVQEGLPPSRAEPAGESESSTGGVRDEADPAATAGSASAPSRSLLTWRQAMLGGLGAVGVLAVVAGGLLLPWDDGESTALPGARAEEAAPAIAVLPFTVRGNDFEVLREGMVDVLSHALDNAAGFRSISNRTILARWRERAPEGREVDLETHLAVAAAAGARYAVVGSAIRLGDEARLVSEIYDVSSSEQIASPSVEGAARNLPGLADRLAVEILKSLVAGDPAFPEVDVGRVLTESPDALRAFLDGERHMRRFEQEAAQAAFEQALEADSAFALSHWRLVEVHTWGPTLDPASRRENLDAAYRLRHRLTDRDALIVEALVAPVRESARLLETAVRRFPDDATAWYQLGERLIHAPQLTPSGDEIERAFERAIDLDPQRPAFYPHAISMAMIYRGDSARSATLVDRFADLSRRSGPYTLDYDPRAGPLAVRLAFASASLAPSALDTLSPGLLGAAAVYLRDPQYWPVADRLFERHVDRGEPGQPRTWARRGLAQYRMLYDGDVAGGLALMHAEPPLEPGVLVLGGRSWPSQMYRAHTAGLPVPDSVLDGLLFGAMDGPGASNYEVLLAGAWAYESNRPARLARARSHLSERTSELDAEDRESEAGIVRDLLRLLDARVALGDGRPEEALGILEEAADGSWVAQWWWAQAALEAGRFDDAAEVLGTYGWPRTTDNAFVRDPPVQYMLGRAFEGLGRREDAARAYATFAEHWSEAAPEARLLVEQARLRARELSDGSQAGRGGGTRGL